MADGGIDLRELRPLGTPAQVQIAFAEGTRIAAEYLGARVSMSRYAFNTVDERAADDETDDGQAAAREEMSALCAEVTALQAIHHMNVVAFVGFAVEGTAVLVVTEELTGEHSLQALLDPNLNSGTIAHLPLSQRVVIAFDIACACAFLHSRGFQQLALSDAVIICTQATEAAPFRAKVFGVTGSVRGIDAVARSKEFAAPELILGMDVDSRCDVFSFGMVLYILLQHDSVQIPERTASDAYSFDVDMIHKSERECESSDAGLKVHTIVAQVVRNCVEYDSESRPDFRSVLTDLKAAVSEALNIDDRAENGTGDISPQDAPAIVLQKNRTNADEVGFIPALPGLRGMSFEVAASTPPRRRKSTGRKRSTKAKLKDANDVLETEAKKMATYKSLMKMDRREVEKLTSLADTAEAHNHLTLYWTMHRNYARAMEHCRRALKLDPKDITALINIKACKQNEREARLATLELPKGWERCRSAEGDTYYLNTITGQTEWQHPCDEAEDSSEYDGTDDAVDSSDSSESGESGESSSDASESEVNKSDADLLDESKRDDALNQLQFRPTVSSHEVEASESTQKDEAHSTGVGDRRRSTKPLDSASIRLALGSLDELAAEIDAAALRGGLQNMETLRLDADAVAFSPGHTKLVSVNKRPALASAVELMSRAKSDNFKHDSTRQRSHTTVGLPLPDLRQRHPHLDAERTKRRHSNDVSALQPTQRRDVSAIRRQLDKENKLRRTRSDSHQDKSTLPVPAEAPPAYDEAVSSDALERARRAEQALKQRTRRHRKRAPPRLTRKDLLLPRPSASSNLCPLTLERLRDPVRTPTGGVFEKMAILAYLARVGPRDPTTGFYLTPALLAEDKDLKRELAKRRQATV